MKPIHTTLAHLLLIPLALVACAEAWLSLEACTDARASALAPAPTALQDRRVDIQRLRLARRTAVAWPGGEVHGLVSLLREAHDGDVRQRAGVLLLDALVLRPQVDGPGLEEVLADLYVEASDPALRERAMLTLLSRDAARLPRGDRGRFLALILPEVLRTARSHQLPPSVTLAQAILESGWGRSRLAREHHNLFGVKAGDGTTRVTMRTDEAGPAGMTSVMAEFRCFGSAGDAIAQHARLLARDPRYASARAHWTDWRAFLTRLAPRYATDPHYSDRLVEIVERYELDRWDALVAAGASADRV